MNMSTGYKPEAQTTIPSKSIHKKKKKKKKKRSTYSNLSVNLCTVLSLSRQRLKLDIDHSFKNGISNTPLSNATSLNTNKEDHFKSFICYRWVTFGVNKKKGILNNIFFFNWGSNDKQKVIALLSFVYFKRGQLERRWFMPQCRGKTTNVTSLLLYDHTVINTAHSYYCNPTCSQSTLNNTNLYNQFATQSQQTVCLDLILNAGTASFHNSVCIVKLLIVDV